MRKKNLFLLGLITVGLALTGCYKESTDDKDAPGFIKTEMGGCNQKSLVLNETNLFTNDTVIVSLQDDTLHFFTGLNYICCAPFVSDYKFRNDTISLYIIDTCNLASGSCYCTCSCYYTFDFYLSDINNQKYFWKVILRSPSETKDKTIGTGEFVVENSLIIP